MHKILVAKPEGGDHLEDIGLDRTIALKWILMGKLDWIHLVQDRYCWRDSVNTVINLRVS